MTRRPHKATAKQRLPFRPRKTPAEPKFTGDLWDWLRAVEEQDARVFRVRLTQARPRPGEGA